MTLLARVIRPLVLALPLFLATAPQAPARPADPVPWLYRGSDVPQDREWVFGELPNGVRYAVRRNGVPPGQVSLRVLMDVGSLYETDAERGYAHLLEHLVFRQSRHLGDGEAIPRWQAMGATFGSDTNAETSFTQTVYKLDLPEADPAKLEESFRLLSGMMIAPTLSEANLKADVPIVLAEMRERGGAAQRVGETVQKTFYAGQLLADRSPIGTVATLEGATEASVRAFHRRWYRPERAIIIAAGDADPAVLAALVRSYFGDWKVPGKPAPAPSFGDPVAPPEGPGAVGETQVIVEPDFPRAVTYAVLRPWRQVNDTIVYNQGLMTDALAQAIINHRLESRARGGGSYLIAQVNQQDVSRSADTTQVSVTPLGEDWQAALRDVRAVIADALAAAPTQEEIDRAVAEMDVAFQVPVEQRTLLPGARLADDLVQAVNIRETVAAPDQVLRIFRESVPLFTPERVLDHTRKLFAGTVTRALYITPKQGEADAARLRLAMQQAVAPDASARLQTAPISFADMPPVGKPGTVAAIRPTGLPGIDQVEFANGVKALLYPTRDEPGRVAVKVRFGGGYRAIAPGDAAYAMLGEMALVGSGQSTLGEAELDRISTGRKLGFQFEIDDAAFQFSADTRQADLADQLYLFAAKLAMPRWDANPVLRARAAARIQYDAFSMSPQGMIERDLKYLQTDRDPRYRVPTPPEIEQTTPDGFRAVWERALATGPVEVQIFGDFDRAGAIASLQGTFGALAKRPPLPASVLAATRRFPAPSARPVMLTHRGDANQAAAMVSWATGGGMADIRESRQLEILTQIFSNRLLQAMREKSGASYAPQVFSSWPVDLNAGGAINAVAQIEPGSIPVFLATARKIAADLSASPPTVDELARVTEPLRQQVTRAATGSAFFMYQLEGATQDPSRFEAVRTLLPDYSETTPERMQQLAARYLAPEKAWELVVVPEGQASVTTAGR